MPLLTLVLVALIQGITEFLPVSSSGHLVVAEFLFDLHIAPADMQGLNVLLHAGTLLALLITYAETWWHLLRSPFTGQQEHRRVLTLLIVATIPGAFAGFFLEEWMAMHMQTLLSVGLAFAVTGLVLILGEYCGSQQQTLWQRLLHPFADEPRKLTTRSALFVGIVQALALVPGLSRSGLTISTGRMIGLDRSEALHFSFLMAVPIIAGASAMTSVDLLLGTLTLPTTSTMLAALGSSFLSSLGAIIFLRSFVVSRSFAWFAPYLFIVAIVTVVLGM